MHWCDVIIPIHHCTMHFESTKFVWFVVFYQQVSVRVVSWVLQLMFVNRSLHHLVICFESSKAWWASASLSRLYVFLKLKCKWNCSSCFQRWISSVLYSRTVSGSANDKKKTDCSQVEPPMDGLHFTNCWECHCLQSVTVVGSFLVVCIRVQQIPLWPNQCGI